MLLNIKNILVPSNSNLPVSENGPKIPIICEKDINKSKIKLHRCNQSNMCSSILMEFIILSFKRSILNEIFV